MQTDRREGLVWAGAGALWVVGLALVRPLTGDLLDPPVSAVVAAAPGWLATAAIEAFGGAAQSLLAAGSALAILALLGLAGALSARSPPLWAVGGAFGGGAFGLYWLVPLPVRPIGVLAAVATALPPVLFVRAGRTAAWQGTDHARRRSMRRVVRGGAAVGAMGVLSKAGAWVGAGVGAPRADDPLPDRYKRETGRTVGSPNTGTDSAGETTGAFGFDFAGMPPRVEDDDDHYVVDINRQDPVVRADSWTLTVTGAVASPAEYSLDDLIDHPDAVSVPVTMVCISNEVGGDLISTTTWQAVPLDALLDSAGVRDEAVDVVTRAVDGYSEAIPVEAAREMAAFVAFGAGGSTLRSAHGFPARLLLPGRYGMKSTKWLTEIELSTSEHDAFWEARGWDEEAVVNTLAYVRGAARRDGEVAVGGVAYAGERGIDSVAVSHDGGETWHEAELEAPPSPYAWRRWRHIFPAPDADEVTVVARAVDGTGERQTAERSGPHPGGSTGWHHKTISL
ncbi:MAG: molybdopterin-dependent oxidoreductase [Halobacteriaceae archaeon]